jgi:hypothetical protein
MYAGVAITALLVLSVARLMKDLLVVRLIRTLARDNAFSKAQRFEICARLAASLGAGGEPLNHGSPAEPGSRPSARPNQP